MTDFPFAVRLQGHGSFILDFVAHSKMLLFYRECFLGWLGCFLLLRKRALIETVDGELKNMTQIEHSRHRSFNNFIANSFGYRSILLF